MTIDETIEPEKEFQIGERVSAGAGHSGTIEKIVDCYEYSPKSKWCGGCKKYQRKRIVLNSGNYCRKTVERMN